MSYEIVVAPEAVADIALLDRRLIDVAESALRHLADNPHEHSRPSAPPAEPPGYLVHEQVLMIDGRFHLLKFLFNFRNDGLTLDVLGIGHIEYG